MMKRRLLVLIVGALLLGAVPVAAAPPGNPFVGSWENIDVVDGSHQHMTIGGGPNLPVSYADDGASVCVPSYGFVPAVGTGSGTRLNDTTVEITVDLYCVTRGSAGRPYIATATFDAVYGTFGAGTLSDSFGNCWWRSGSPASCP